jgi:hypothetical protein
MRRGLVNTQRRLRELEQLKEERKHRKQQRREERAARAAGMELERAGGSQRGEGSGRAGLSMSCSTRPASRPVRSCSHCEVSERATHRSSPHGPCEPSARVMGRARTRWIFLNGILCYRKQLPNETTALPTSASSPLPFRLTSAPSSHGYDPYATTYDATFCIQRTGAPVDCIRRYSATTNLPSFPFSDALPHRTDLPRA